MVLGKDLFAQFHQEEAVQFFVGLTFFQNYLHFKKIDSYRKRFDHKYGRSHMLQMTLLPPFVMEDKFSKGLELDELVEHLHDEIENNFIGHEPNLDIHFTGFDFKTGRSSVLFLTPQMPDDLYHCQERILETVRDSEGSFKKRKGLGKKMENGLHTFLPIGRFLDTSLLEAAIETAKVEFNQPFQLQAKDIILFEKMPGQWIPRKNLFTFSQGPDNLYDNEDLSLLRHPSAI